MIKEMAYRLMLAVFLVGFVLYDYSLSQETIQANYNYNSSSSVQIDPFSGAASYSIPINMPPGRGNIAPNIFLTYSSTFKNGIYGVGWTDNISYVERSTKMGVPSYDTSDTFVLSFAGSTQELVYDSVKDRYYPKIEGAFNRIEYNGSYWIVTDKIGTKYYFGQTQSSQIFEDSSEVFRWSLDKVQDISGNYMEISYVKHDNWIYPDKLQYAKSATVPNFYATVVFELDTADRPDIQVNYVAGFEVKLTKIVKAIDVEVQGNHYSRYDLTHQISPNSQRSLLVQVDVQNGTANPIPPLVFNYQNQKGFSQDVSWTIPDGMQFMINISPQPEYVLYDDAGVREVDINNDGYMDLVRWRQGATKKVYINNGTNGFTDQPSEFPPSAPVFVEDASQRKMDQGVRLVDINGDGLMDYVQKRFNRIVGGGLQEFHDQKVYLRQSDGSWSANQSIWYLPNDAYIMKKTCTLTCFQEFTGTFIVDVNNDGLPDVVRSNKDSVDGDVHKVYLNTGSGWTFDANWNVPTEYTDFKNGATLVDLNGDNLPDIFYLQDNEAHVFMNNGSGWFEDVNSPWAEDPGSGTNAEFLFVDIEDGWTQLHDVNGDGLADLVDSRLVVTAALFGSIYGKKVLINTGYGWYNDDQWDIWTADFRDEGTRMFDINADGMPDHVTNYAGNSKVVYLNQGKPADLLMSVDNGFGGLHSITYTPSTTFTQAEMPFVRQLVKSIAQSDAYSGDAYTTEYEYYDGKYDFVNKEFLGFGEVVQIHASGTKVVTEFHVDNILKGRPIRSETYDQSGNLFLKEEYSWTVENILSDSNFAYMDRKDNLLYDGDIVNDGKRIATTYTYYNLYGESWVLNQTKQWGEMDFTNKLIDIGNDHRTITQTYGHNYTDWIIDVPAQIYVKDSSENIVRKKWFLYDNNIYPDSSPSAGRLTKSVDWLTGPDNNHTTVGNPVTEYVYYANGNLHKTIDPNSNVQEISQYDSNEVFPVEVKNEKQQVASFDYYGVDGVPLDDGSGLRGVWGQLKSKTDPNLVVTSQTFDDLGRVEQNISPLDSVSHPTQITSSFYDTTKNYLKRTISTRENHGQSGTLDSVEFVDSLGRVIQRKREDGDANLYIVSDQVEYNSRGFVERKYLPYYTLTNLDDTDPVDTNRPYITYDYDDMGRVTKITQPNGNYSSISYDHWETTTIDENGHQRKSYKDAYGRLVRIEEFTGADGRSTYYPETSSGCSMTNSCYTLYTAVEYEYDSEGNLTKTIVNADSAEGISPVVTTIGYDNMDRRTSIDEPDIGNWTYEYYENGDIKKQTDAKLQEIEFEYDELNRIKKKIYSDLTSDTLFEYDNDIVTQQNDVGRLSGVTYDSGGVAFHYDEHGRELKGVKTIDQDYSVERAYNALGNLVDLKYPEGIKLEFAYNSAGQVVEIKQGDDTLIYGDVTGDGEVTSIDASQVSRHVVGLYTLTGDALIKADVNGSGTISSIDASQIARYAVDLITEFAVEDMIETFATGIKYNAAGQVTYLQFGNGTKTYYLYDDDTLRLVHKKAFLSLTDPIEDTSGWATAPGDLQDFQYNYDAAGNILQITDLVNSASQTFQYDHLNRLIYATNQHYGTKTYQYDVLGNIKTKDGKNYTYDDNCGGGPHAVCGIYDPATSVQLNFTYDANGNMLTKQLQDPQTPSNDYLVEYTYNIDNRLSMIEKDGMEIARYEYDSEGQRSKKIVNSETTKFIGTIYESSPTDSKRHIYLGNERVATVVDLNRFFYYHTDHLRGTNIVTDRTGTVKEKREYAPFGSVSWEYIGYDQGEDQARLYFNQHYEDEESNLYFMQARYYDPEIGRFLTPDKYVQAPENSQSFNRYSYVVNNPVNLTDPSGNFFEIIFAAISAVAGYLATYGVEMATQAVVSGLLSGISAAVNHQDIWDGFVTGAIGGGILSGLSPGLNNFTETAARSISGLADLSKTWQNVSRFTSGLFSGAAAGAASAAYSGSDVGTGSLSGGISGGISAFGAADLEAFGDGGNIWQSTANRLVDSAANGAVIGATYAGVTGSNVLGGAGRGALSWLVGEAGNMAFGHTVGFVGSGFKAPNTDWGVFAYDIPYAMGWLTTGNVISGKLSRISEPLVYVDGTKADYTYLDHELGHVSQSKLFGPGYLPVATGSLTSGGIIGIITIREGSLLNRWTFGQSRYGFTERFYHDAPGG